MKNFTYIDLFAGIGGFHQAMSDLGGICVFASDIDADCRKTYINNYGITPFGDITKIDEKDIPAHDVLCGGFPCQAFSKAGSRLGFDDPTKGTLFFDIMRIANYHHPKYMLLENVRNLASHDNGNTWRVIRNSITQAGYNVLPNPVIYSPHYIGIPQHRERVFIMCIRKDIGEIPEFVFDSSNAQPCNAESILQDNTEIEDITRYTLSEDYIQLIDLWNDFLQGIATNDPMPGFPVWAECFGNKTSEEELSVLPKWKSNFIRRNEELYSRNQTFIDSWLTRARKNKLFFGAKAKLEWQAGKTSKPNIWDTIMHFRPSGLRCKPSSYFPALVAITQTSIVGSRRRKLTPRECARLQSFPDTFTYDTDEAQAYKQFGNAVNVEVVKLFAKFLFGDSATREKYTLKQS